MRTPKKSNNNLQRYYPTEQQMKWKISNKNKQFHASLGSLQTEFLMNTRQ